MTFDTLIRECLVYDGTGAAPFTADVALADGAIQSLTPRVTETAGNTIDARGLALAPGFIDVHTHDDFAAVEHPDMAFKTRGGVTTCIVGNCGFGPAPRDAAVHLLEALTPGIAVPSYDGHAGFAALLATRGTGVNIGVLAGHGTLRYAAMGTRAAAAGEHELATMEALLDEALDAGVFGLSSGLIYEPGRHADSAELVRLAARMRGTGALYATHMRDEGDGLLQSVDEAILIGREAGVPVLISHLKAAGRDNWGRVEAALARIDAACEVGQEVFADQYPYTAGSTMLRAVLDNGAFLDAAGDSAPAGGIGRVNADDVMVASAPGHAHFEGKTIAEIMAELAGTPGGSFDTARDVAEHVVRQAPAATAVLHMMDERDVQTVMRHAGVMIGSDGLPTLKGKPHPRLFNTFARVLGHYSRDLGLLDLPTAIHRMTGLSAQRFGLTDRGRVAAGYAADLVLFDPATIIDRGTYADPVRYPAGIRQVWVNGQCVVNDGHSTGSRPGQVLRRAAAARPVR